MIRHSVGLVDPQGVQITSFKRPNTDVAPWHVIPSDRKWYRNWAVTRLLLEHLRALDPRWPAADFDVDVEVEKARLLKS